MTTETEEPESERVLSTCVDPTEGKAGRAERGAGRVGL
jgi:hypothetical protein